MLRCLFTFILLISIVGACKQTSSKVSWHYAKSFPLTNVNPVSITGDANNLYVSSGLKTEVHKLNYDGGLQLAIKNLRRPKYINMLNPGIFVVAESEAHVVSTVNGQDYINTIPTNENLDTPYGVSVVGNSMVITDYFKNHIYYNKEGKVMSFGNPGIGDNQFNGPSDVQIKNGLIYIADSRNNRVVVYDDMGKYQFSIGDKDGIKIVGGIYVADDEIIVTDYQGNRVLVYDLKGNLLQILTDKFDQPSDAFINKKEMFVVNYYSNSIMVYNRY
jgi:NHL repeat